MSDNTVTLILAAFAGLIFWSCGVPGSAEPPRLPLTAAARAELEAQRAETHERATAHHARVIAEAEQRRADVKRKLNYSLPAELQL